MPNYRSLPWLAVKTTKGMGRGVFAKVFIKKGTRIEVCHVIPFESRHKSLFLKTPLDSYCFLWEKGYCIATGFGSLYNHSKTPNASYSLIFRKKIIVVKATQDIAAGQQVFIDYGWNPEV